MLLTFQLSTDLANSRKSFIGYILATSQLKVNQVATTFFQKPVLFFQNHY